MAGPRQSPLVHLKDGAVRGTVRAGVTAFLGIPYAAAPFGANRMRPPQPVQPWNGERDATSYGPTAPKGDYPPQYAPLFPEVVIARRGLPEPQHMDTRPGRDRASGAGLDSRRLVHERIRIGR